MVAALQRQHEPAAALALGHVLRHAHARRQPGDAQREPGEGVEPVRVGAERDEDEVGPEPLGEPWQDGPVETRQLVAGPGGDGEVHRRALARADARLGERARARVDPLLVRRDHEHARVVVERLLGPVPVVDVEVHDEDALGAVLGLGVAGGDGDVRHQTKPHRLRRPRVVARRTPQREPVVDAALHHGVHEREQVPARDSREVEGGRRRVRVRVERPAARLAKMLHQVEVAPQVDALQRLAGRGLTLHVLDLAQARVRERPQHRVEPGRALGVAGLGVGVVALGERDGGHGSTSFGKHT